MAYMRSLTIRARIFAQQRFIPSVTYVNHHEDRKNQHSNENLNSFLQTRSYGVYGSNKNTSFTFRDPKWSHFRHGPMITTASGFMLARNMSTNIVDVLADKTMEILSKQAANISSEVAVAAADSWLPIAAIQYAIDGVHTFTGLNWWASIAITTLVIKTLLLPVRIYRHKTFSMSWRTSADENPRIFPEICIGLLIAVTFPIQNMVEKVPSFQTGGASWFLDLTAADSFYILPFLNAYVFSLYSGKYLQNVKLFLVALSISLLPSFPQALFCHWIASNLFSLLYKLLMRPSVKKFFNIPIPLPKTPSATRN